MVTDLLRYLHFDLCFTLWTLFRRCLYWRTCASLVLGQGEASIQDRGKRREGGPPIQDRGKSPPSKTEAKLCLYIQEDARRRSRSPSTRTGCVSSNGCDITFKREGYHADIRRSF